jgi:hypothetical protein
MRLLGPGRPSEPRARASDSLAMSDPERERGAGGEVGICLSVGGLRFECPTADITGQWPAAAQEWIVPATEWMVATKGRTVRSWECTVPGSTRALPGGPPTIPGVPRTVPGVPASLDASARTNPRRRTAGRLAVWWRFTAVGTDPRVRQRC